MDWTYAFTPDARPDQTKTARFCRAVFRFTILFFLFAVAEAT
jgi:hypothetical protein